MFFVHNVTDVTLRYDTDKDAFFSVEIGDLRCSNFFFFLPESMSHMLNIIYVGECTVESSTR